MTIVLNVERVNIAQKILCRLDSVFDLRLFPAIELARFSSFRSLRAFNELWASYGQDERSCELQRIQNYLHFGSPKEQLELLADLRRCEDIFMSESSEYHMSSLDIPVRKRRSEPSGASLFAARSLFNVLEASGRCSCHTYGARLCIETHRDSDLNEEYDFNLFLEIDERWQEAHFLAVGKSQSSTEFVAEDGLTSDKKEILAMGRKKVEFLCEPIKKIWKNFPTYRLKFLVENDMLWKLQSEPSNVAAHTATQAITFQRFMAEESFNLTDKSKRILAVFLGYAVLHLLETPWLHSSWGPASILFLRTPSGTPLKPYIELHFGKDIEFSAANTTSCNDDDDEDFDPDDLISHPYPSLVSLAAMLIELHLARRLQAIAQVYDLKFDDDMNECAKYTATTQIFKRCKNDISEATREAIEQCLDRTIVVDEARKSLDAHTVRSIFYTKVVSRLEYDLEQTFKHISIETLDAEAQKLDLTGWSQPTVLNKVIPDPRKDDRLLGSRVQRPLRGQKRGRQDSEISAWMTLDWVGDAQFFDDETAPSDISFVA